MLSIKEWQKKVHNLAKEKGWHQDRNEAILNAAENAYSKSPGLKEYSWNELPASSRTEWIGYVENLNLVPHNEEKLAQYLININAEISECWEEFRRNRKPNEIYYDESGAPHGIAVEIADVFIRNLDMCAAIGIEDIEKFIEIKHEFNKTRPWRHGKKRA